MFEVYKKKTTAILTTAKGLVSFCDQMTSICYCRLFFDNEVLDLKGCFFSFRA